MQNNKPLHKWCTGIRFLFIKNGLLIKDCIYVDHYKAIYTSSLEEIDLYENQANDVFI